MQTGSIVSENQHLTPWSLDRDRPYQDWKAAKLDCYSQALNAEPVRLNNLAHPSESERAELSKRCQKTNLAVYETSSDLESSDQIRANLRDFSDSIGLQIAERHRSAGDHGIVALHVTDAPRQAGYIPYSRRPMNWHSDGYYNAPGDQIRAMVLHCVIPAGDGGKNQFFDPEIAYIRLRDTNPDYIAALMHPAAMTIPTNTESDGSERAKSVGPVFSVDSDGKLAIRYTARTRSISWREDSLTEQAVAALTEILNSDDPLILTARLKSGQGVLCNNVLHNRTGFDPDTKQQSDRLVFRIRFHNRVKGS